MSSKDLKQSSESRSRTREMTGQYPFDLKDQVFKTDMRYTSLLILYEVAKESCIKLTTH